MTAPREGAMMRTTSRCLIGALLISGLLFTDTSLPLSAEPALAQQSASASSPAGRRFLEKETFLDMETINAPAIAPDGSHVLFSRGRVDRATDTNVSNLWIVDIKGTRVRELTSGTWNDSSAVWAPDGNRIAFLSDRSGSTQIHVLWRDTGDIAQLTHLDRPPSGLVWSPDGKQIAYTSLVPDNSALLPVELPSFGPGAKLASPAMLVDRLQWRFDGRGNMPRGFTHIFIVDAVLGGTPRTVTSGNYAHNDPQWSADGRRIYFSAIRKPDAEYLNNDSEIYAVDVATGEIRPLTDRRGPDVRPRPSPDGKWIAFSINQLYPDAELSDVYVMDASSAKPRRWVGDLMDSPQDVTWAPDSSGIYFLVNERGSTQLYFAPLSGAAKRITDGVQVLNGLSLASNQQVAATVTSPQKPPSLITFDARTPKATTVLADVNADALAQVQLGESEELTFKAPDGLALQGWLIKPADFKPGQKYPLILYIHGGPYSMYNVAFNWPWQHFAAKGYAVLYMNPRGSTGYGGDFLKGVWYDFPGKDLGDLMAGVDAAIAKGFIDTDNLFVAGGSAGGILTAWIVTHTERFRAAVCMRPMAIDWASYVGTSDVLHWYKWFEKYPWQDPAGFARRSPLTYVEKVTTPTLLMTGEADLRTPIGQTEEFYRALKLLKKDTLMIRMPDEYHGWRRPSHQLLQQLYTLAWFERYRTPKTAPTAF